MSANDRQEGGEHYKRLTPEPWDIVYAWGLDFYLGNAQKYIARAAHKTGEGQRLDLKKAIHYLEKKLELVGEAKVANIFECVNQAGCDSPTTCQHIGVCRWKHIAKAP